MDVSRADSSSSSSREGERSPSPVKSVHWAEEDEVQVMSPQSAGETSQEMEPLEQISE